MLPPCLPAEAVQGLLDINEGSAAECLATSHHLCASSAYRIIGFLCESTADIQKFRFKQNPANKGKFITVGDLHMISASLLAPHSHMQLFS